MRLMRTITAAAAATLILLAGAIPAAASPTTRPGGDQAAGRLIRQHQCRPGAEYGNGITGWLVDDRETARRDLRYLSIGQATNGMWRWDVQFHCYR